MQVNKINFKNTLKYNANKDKTFDILVNKWK